MPKRCYVKKRFRSDSLAVIDQANKIITEYWQQGYKLTLRQLYYQFVSRDLVPNTQQSYKNIGSIVNDGRLAGMIDWLAIEDRTRNMRENAHWDSPGDIVRACAQQFRHNLWDTQDCYVECWIEKDALVGVIEGVCAEMDVPYFACRGYTSQSEMWAAAQRFLEREKCGKHTVILHLGDHDPSGIDMTRDIQDRLSLFGSSVEIDRIALLKSQIDKYQPPPNFAKATDARYESYRELYGDESWELDALEPSTIVGLISDHLRRLMNMAAWDVAVEQQQLARDQLTSVSEKWDEIVGDI